MSDNSTSLASLASTIKKGIDNRIKELHTALPGIIQSFDPSTQLAKVQPAIKRIFITRDGEQETLIPSDLPVLINVPIIYPRGGGFSLTFPVKPNDECLILFCERSIDNWHETGEINPPGAKRFHSLSDAVALVGLSSKPNKIPNYDPDNLVLKKDDDSVYIKIKDDSNLEVYCENIEVNANSTATVTCPESTFIGNVTVNGNITCTGVVASPTVAAGSSLTVASKEMNGHVHPQANDSAGNTEQNTGAPL